MPLRLPDKLPAIELLKHENIFVMDESRAHSQEIRPLKICVLNLMPLKITTETDLVRLLSNTPLQLEVYFMKLKSHTPKNTPIEHMMMFYKDFAELSKQKFDGMIVTGAPIETMEYEEVEYWQEIQEIFNWARTHVTSTLYICWGAQAGLYHFYGVPKYQLDKKKFGIFPQKPLDPSLPIFRGFDDIFNMPHSRHTEVRREDIEKVPGLDIIAESAESGVSSDSQATKKPAEREKAVPKKVGAILKVKGNKYRVTKSKAKGSAVEFTGYTNKKKKKVTIPESITVQGVEYDVTSIGEKAFSNCKKLTLLEIKTKKLTKKTVAKKTFKSIRKKTVIKVPKSKYKAYKKVLRARGLNKKVKIKK